MTMTDIMAAIIVNRYFFIVIIIILVVLNSGCKVMKKNGNREINRVNSPENVYD